MNARTTIFRRTAGALLLTSCAMLPLARATPAALPEELIGATERFLEQAVSEHLQRSEIHARHEISVNRLDPRLRLAPCDQPLDARLGGSGLPIGRVTVRVSCAGSSPWSVFVPAQVRLYRPVVVANRSLLRDSRLGERDVSLAERDVSALAQGYLTSLDEVLGNKLTRPLQPDQVVTPNQLELAEVVRKGDQLVIVARSGAISVRMPGEAMADGAPGRQIAVRNLRSGRVVKARVVGAGQVEVAM